MLVKDFSFNLPSELIAQVPSETRQSCKLLVIDRATGAYEDRSMEDFPCLLEKGSVLVINDTKVRKARVYGYSDNKGRVEFIFLNPVGDDRWSVLVSKAKKQRPGKVYSFYANDDEKLESPIAQAMVMEEGPDGTRIIRTSRLLDEDFFQKCGHVPLPPYIRREDDFSDEERYQTVYAQNYGSVAAPTAGLHYTNQMLEDIQARGIQVVRVTLHVGMGTFSPMHSDTLEGHHMHTEWYHISPESAQAINKAKLEGRKVVATGTTSVRTLESAFKNGAVQGGFGSTALFITPGFKFNVVDQLLTNFHTPESTLLVLVSAFSSREKVLKAYEHAVEMRYRFFSYGDATFFR